MNTKKAWLLTLVIFLFVLSFGISYRMLEKKHEENARGKAYETILQDIFENTAASIPSDDLNKRTFEELLKKTPSTKEKNFKRLQDLNLLYSYFALQSEEENREYFLRHGEKVGVYLEALSRLLTEMDGKEREAPVEIIVLSQYGCPACDTLRRDLRRSGILFKEYDYDDQGHQETLRILENFYGRPKTVPFVIVNQEALGEISNDEVREKLLVILQKSLPRLEKRTS